MKQFKDIKRWVICKRKRLKTMMCKKLINKIKRLKWFKKFIDF